MHLVTADEIREMDRLTIESFGLPGRVLMENAGRGATRVLMNKFSDIASKRVGIIAGRGNNGGDGFVIARYLAHAGVNVTVYLLSEISRLTGDAKDNFKLLAPLDINVIKIPDESSFKRHKTEMTHEHIWVDAILGTGLNSDVAGFFKSVIEFINALNRPVLAVDIASGLHTDSGQICGICIQATLTATFGFPKIGHIQLPGAACTGELHVIDIGIPPHIVKNVGPRQHLLTKDMVLSNMIPRPSDIHKGGTGHVLVVAGSPGKTGAAAMCAMSALRSGAGLVTLGVPKSLNPVVEPLGLEVMTVPMDESKTGTFSEKAGESILTLLEDKKCLGIGPGIGTETGTMSLVHQLVKESPVPIVIDADGLNNLANNPAILLKRKSEIILTPHPGEMARLVNARPGDIQKDRVGYARKFAETYNVHLVLKGARTIVAHPNGDVYINLSGNPGMASAGMGDVLTGMVAGFIAQGYPLATAAQIAVYLHGDAGDNLADARGPFGYIASDVMDSLPEAIKRLMAGNAFSNQYDCGMPHQTIL